MYLKKSNLKIIVFIILLFNCYIAMAGEEQELKSQTIFEYIKNDYQNAVNLNFEKPSKNQIIGVTGLTIVSFVLDEEIREKVSKNRTLFLKKYFNLTNDLGHSNSIIPMFLTFYGIGTITNDERMKKVSFSSLEASLASGGAVLLFKSVFGRARPYMEEGSGSYSFFNKFDDDRASFPSAHSAIAWAMFTPYAKEYGTWIYAVPTSVSLARIYRDKHWSSDVVIGAVIGYAAGTVFYKWKDENLIIYPNGFLFKY